LGPYISFAWVVPFNSTVEKWYLAEVHATISEIAGSSPAGATIETCEASLFEFQINNSIPVNSILVLSTPRVLINNIGEPMKSQEATVVLSCREGEISVWSTYTVLADPKGLIPHPDNNNLHSQEQVDIMKAVLKANGWRDSVVVSESTDRIVAGHLRVLAAIDMGLEKIPVDVQAFASRVEEVKHLTADNELARLAEFDKKQFFKTRKDLKKTLNKNQFEMAFIKPQDFGLKAWPKDDEDKEKGKNTKLPIQGLLKEGDIWLVGEHRLILGATVNDQEDHLQKFLRKFRKLTGKPAILQKTNQTFDEVMDERRNDEQQ
jgi:hypothetical protein